MKTLVVSLVALFVGFQASARSINPASLMSDLTEFNLQEGGTLASRNIVSGTVVVNRAEGKITLTVMSESTCPPGVMCAAVVGPLTYTWQAEIIAYGTDECGTTTYHAKTDKRPMDGNLVEFYVSDHQYNSCGVDGTMPLPPSYQTEVTFILAGPFDRTEEVNQLWGEALHPVRYYTLPVVHTVK